MTHLDSTYLVIGTRRQFFFDDCMIEQVQDLTRRYYRPAKVGDAPVLQRDRPWEHTIYFTCNTWNVIRDPADGLFRCWYEDWDCEDLGAARNWRNPSDGKICVAFYSTTTSRVCYAQSEDGRHWEKPTFDGGTNVVLGDASLGMAHCAYILLDEGEADLEQRYKAVFENRRVEGGNDMAGEGSFRVAGSPDGIHWKLWDRTIRYGACGDVLGDVITISRDPETGMYWANNRNPAMCSSSVLDDRKPIQGSWLPGRVLNFWQQENRRRVFRSESTDLCNWSTPRPLVVPDASLDNIDDSFYGMEQVRIGDDWLGFLNVFHMTDNTMDVQLTYSRDGRHFQRVQPGRPWLSPRGGDAWDRYMVSICSKPCVVGDDLYVYHGGTTCHHDWWLTGRFEGLDVPEAADERLAGTALGLAKIKKDRFVSLSSAEAREGLLVTPPFRTSGTRLRINARTRRGGSVRVAVADAQGNVYKGMERDTCVPFTGDAVEHEITWRNSSAPPDEPFKRLYFYLADADLFSFEWVSEPPRGVAKGD